MNSQIQRETALILQFPPLGARMRGVRITQANPKQNGTTFEPSISTFGGAWYHEAAILESERPRKA